MPDDYADLIRGVVGSDPSERVRRIARQSNVPDDIAEDYLKTTQIESGHNVNVRASSAGALGFGQVMPDVKGGTMRTVGGRKYNLKNPDENIEAGLKYFAEGGNDPVGRRLYYFGGPRAKAHYERTGQIPNISDSNMTAAQYVKATGGQQGPKRPQQPAPDEYSQLIRETVAAPQAQAQPKPRPRSPFAGVRAGASGIKPTGVEVGGSVGQPSAAAQGKGFIRGMAEMAGSPTQLLPADAQDYANEIVAKGAAGLMRTGSGVVKTATRFPTLGAPNIAEKYTQPLRQGLNKGADMLSAATQAEDAAANRGVISQTAQDVAGGGISSAPAMVLTGLGVPAPVAFGLQSYLESTGRDADWKDVLKETGIGAATGALFEIPLPARLGILAKIGAKLGIVGGGTYGIEKLAGVPESEARKNAAVNALFAASGVRGREAPLAESLTQVPDIQGKLAERAQSVEPTLTPSIAAKRTALREGTNESINDVRSNGAEQNPVAGIRVPPQRVSGGNGAGERPDSSTQSLLSTKESAPQDRTTTAESQISQLATTGIAHRVETATRGSEPARGESIGAEESIQRGRDLLTKSDDPGRLVAKTVTAFDRTGAVSPESMAIVRAQHEQLAQEANRAFDANGLNSPEFTAAEQARRDFYDNAVKPMQTAWSNTGRAQQGETAIDTGTFYGLFRAFRDTTGREMNPREQLTAKKLAQTSSEADLRLSNTQKRLVDTLNSICPS